MKLQNMIEAKTSKYLTDVDQIHEFIKKYFFVIRASNGTGDQINEKDYIINADFSVSFITKDCLQINLQKSQMQIKIHKAHELIFEHCNFDDMDFLPKSCNILKFKSGSLPPNCIIKTNVKKILLFGYFDNIKIESLTLSSSTSLKLLFFYSCDLDMINKIDVRIPNIERCDFYECKKIDFSKIEIHSHIKTCVIDNSDIGNKNFNGIEKFKSIDVLKFDYTTFDSYSGIENTKASSIMFMNTKTQKGIINLLLTQCQSIGISGNINKTVYGIISKYLRLENRVDHIMDCALELIDAGFEEAAEL